MLGILLWEVMFCHLVLDRGNKWIEWLKFNQNNPMLHEHGRIF